MVFALQHVLQTSFVLFWQPILYGRWWWRLAPPWRENMECGKYQQKPSWKSVAGKARWNIPGSREQQARLLCLLSCVCTLDVNDVNIWGTHLEQAAHAHLHVCGSHWIFLLRSRQQVLRPFLLPLHFLHSSNLCCPRRWGSLKTRESRAWSNSFIYSY